jgi:hypothetical protein
MIAEWQGTGGRGLPGPGETRLDLGSESTIGIVEFREHRVDHGARADDAHRASDDVEHLGKFVQVSRSQEVAPAPDALQVKFLRDLPVREAGRQAADLNDREPPLVHAATLLSEQWISPKGDGRPETQHTNHRDHDRCQTNRDHQIDSSLAPRPAPCRSHLPAHRLDSSW